MERKRQRKSTARVKKTRAQFKNREFAATLVNVLGADALAGAQPNG